MQTKNALGNLLKRYKAVIKKCNMLNKLGALALASFLGTGLLLSPMLTTSAITATNPSGNTITTGGMLASPSDSFLTNNGDILGGHNFLAPFTNVNSYAGMYGYHTTGSIDYFFTNTGTIDISNISSVTSGANARAFAYGMYASGTGNHNLTNSGDIIIRAEGGTANSNNAYADAYAYGMYANDTGNHSLTNYGDIAVRAEGGNADSSAAAVGADAYGMYADGTGNHRLTNSGYITVTAQGGNADSSAAGAIAYAYAYGMNANGTGNHRLTNSGYITVTAQSENADSSGTNANANAFAYGMYAFGTGNHSLTNSGDIRVSAQGGNADSNAANADAYARAIGMSAVGAGNHNLTNSGHITVTARGGTATAHTNAIAHAFAYGMYVSGTPTTGGEHLINNYGIINATATKGIATGAGNKYAAAHAFEVFGYNSYSVGTFATTLQPWTVTVAANNGTADTVFGIQTGQVINFKNTTLILRPQVTAQGVELGKVYNVKDMIAVADGYPTNNGAVSIPATNDVTGKIAQATAEVPFIKATLTNGHAPLSATVRLDANVNAHTSPGSISAMQTLTQVQGQMSNITRELLQLSYNDIFAKLSKVSKEGVGLNAGSDFAENKWTAFLIPYANFFENSEYGFDGSNVGFTGGASYRVNDSFSFGAHFDFNVSDFDADSVNMTSDAISIALGLHATYTITPEWYVRAQATFAHSQTDNDYEGAHGSPIHADNKYFSNSLYFSLNTGYVWEFAKNHSLTPEIGFSYLSTRSSAYDVEWSLAGIPMSMYDLHYDDTYYSAFYTNINLTWRSKWMIDNASSIALLAGLGIRQNISGNEVKNDFYALNSRYSTTAYEDMTTWLADVGIEFKHNDLSVKLDYNGSYGTEQTNHGVSLMFKYDF